jgi:ssDNA-binding Zn-finger/Zn-ribbon topoisomerase 1
MQDLNPLERRFFDWLGRRSPGFLFVMPIVAFLVASVVGIAFVSVVSHQSPATDTYATWVTTVVLLAGIALYLLTLYSLAAFFVRTRRFRLLELHQTMREIRAMSWHQFEDLVAAMYQSKGYDVEPRGGPRPDGGIDLIVRKGQLRWIVQCKHYRDDSVGVRALRELLGVVTASGATGGVLVACGLFDEQALEFAKATDKLELIGGEQLQDLIAGDRVTSPVTCPKCGSSMREKTGRFGPFLGCSNFPACHGWVPLAAQAKTG